MSCFAQTISGNIDGHDYVDLGLPSGRLWATCNVGAATPTECGDYFAWGETTPKETYSWDNYKWKKGDEWLKYNPWEAEENDALNPEDDAAVANWGESWKMPTSTDVVELLDNCDWEWTKDYNDSGMAGEIGTSKINSNTIFLPASGYGLEDGIKKVGYTATYNTTAYWFGSSWTDCIMLEARNTSPSRKIHTNLNGRADGSSIRAVVNNSVSRTTNINSHAVRVFAEKNTIHITDAHPNTTVQIYNINGRSITTALTDEGGNAVITLAKAKTTYVVTVGNMSTKIITE